MGTQGTENYRKLVIGDWSGDGHSITTEIIVKLTGDDVSNEKLAASVADAESATGVKLESLLAEYEESDIPSATHERLIDAGFVPIPEGSKSVSAYGVPDLHSDGMEEGPSYDTVALLMWFMGYSIPNFDYEVIQIPIIVGGFNAPVRGFGYGLF